MSDELVPNQIILGERNYEGAVAILMGQAQQSLMIFDADLSRGAFNSLEIFEALNTFLAGAPNTQLQIVVHSPYYLQEHCTRILKLLATYSHKMKIYITDQRAQSAQDAFVLADDAHYLHRFHINQARFKYVLDDANATRPLIERFEALLEVAPNVVSATTLGL